METNPKIIAVADLILSTLKVKGGSISVLAIDSDDAILEAIKESAEKLGVKKVLVQSCVFGNPANYYFDAEFDVSKSIRIFGGGLSWGMEYEYATNFHKDVVQGISLINGAFSCRKSWASLEYPSRLKAEYSGMELDALSNMMFNSILCDKEELRIRQAPLKSILSKGKEVQIEGEDVDLKFSIAGKRGVSCYGRYNIPDGEVFVAPVEDSMSGHIGFKSLDWGLLEDVELYFKEGRVVKSSAKTEIMQNWLNTKIHLDDGADRVGEFAIGTNKLITNMVGDALFDEKKYGTFHIALGGGYGSIVKSYRHWDIVKDNDTQYTVKVDRETILQNGEVLI